MAATVGSTITVQWTPDWDAEGHDVTLTVTRPDGTTVTPAPTPASGGGFEAELTVDQPGRYRTRWHDVTLDVVGTDVFDVWPEDPRFLISVDDAATALQWPAADRAKHLDTLRLYVAAATEVIEDIVGAVLVRTITQRAAGGRTGVLLWERPASADDVTVAVSGSAWSGHVVDTNAAIVYADGAGSRFPDGVQNIVVTYTTGGESIPPSIQLAARELVRHLWQIGQQARDDSAPTYGQAPTQTGQSRTGFAVPKRVIELCGNHYALPGIG